MTPVSLIAAFVAGFLSFISPPVVILIPAYVAFVVGAAHKDRTLISSLCMVTAFSVTLVAIGASATRFGGFVSLHKPLPSMIAGGVLILVGLYAMGFLKISLSNIRTSGFEAVVVGIVFAFAWTPVGGPMLTAMLSAAAAPSTVQSGIWLLAVYSLGLAIPFVLTALALDQFFASIVRARSNDLDATVELQSSAGTNGVQGFWHDGTIEFAVGAVLIVMGLLMLIGRFGAIAWRLSPYLPTF